MASDLASLRKSSNVHSEGDPPPPAQAVPSTSVVDRGGRDPSVNHMLLPPVGGGMEPVGEPRPTKACPMVQSESLDFADRSRKRGLKKARTCARR